MFARLLTAIGFGSAGLLGSVALQAAAGHEPAQRTNMSQPGPERCLEMNGQQIGGATISKAEFVESNAKLPPFKDPLGFEFCRVNASVSPADGSNIKIVIWLPVNWNGKFLGTGGGGFEGGYAAAPLSLRLPVSIGYAAIATDAGHDAEPEPKWALGSREKLVDYGHRANHVGALVGKAVVAAYYGLPVKRAYFQGCSNGGRDALMLAQRYPSDYDAIIAGAPANDFTGLMTSFARYEQLVRLPGIDLSAAKLKLVQDAAMRTCDAADGVADGLIERPQRCRFDPAVLQCKAGDESTCLSKGELGVVKSIYRGIRTSQGGLVTPGLAIGSESEWFNWLTSPKSAGSGFGRPFFSNIVYRDPAWTLASFSVDRDYAVAREKVSPIIDAIDPDLTPFLAGGGKLLMYHGWDDAAIPPVNTLNYYSLMRQQSGRRAAKQTRLFMLPGVAHCAGGDGPSSVDYLGELDRWSVTGVAPEKLNATKPESVYRAMAGLPTASLMSRPLCAWPKAAHYKGSGSTNDAANFSCR